MVFTIFNFILATPNISLTDLILGLILLSPFIYFFYRLVKYSNLMNKDIWSDKQIERIKFRQLQRHQHKLKEEKVEKLFLRQKKRDKFLNSSEYKYIKQFVKKYQGNESNQDFLNLQMLLESSQWKFTFDELKIILADENKRQRIENCKSRILINKPNTRQEILESYLEYFGSNNEETLEGLTEVLKEKQLYCGHLIELKTELKNLEKEIELRLFEQRLLKENEQILLESIDEFSGYDFEDFLKNLFSKMGYQVKQTKLSGDQGADLVVIKFGVKTVIQAKRFGSKVGNKAVQEILAAMSLYEAQKGMVITNNANQGLNFNT